MTRERSVFGSAALIAVATLGSRVSGLARDMLLVQTFGVSWVHDAWNYAFQIPNLFRRLFGEGAIAAVFVPTFTRTLETDGAAAAWRLLAGVLALLTTTLVGVIALLELVILVVALSSGGLAPETAEARTLLLRLTALMLPFMLGVCVLALLASVLNAVGSFVPAALMPIVLNLVMIVGIVWVGPALGGAAIERQIFGVGLAVLAASALQLALLWPVLRRFGVQVGWRWAPADPGVRRTIGLMGPVLLGQGVLALGVFLDAQICTLLTHKAGTPATADWFGLRFAYPLQEGALTTLTAAARLYQFPLGVLAVSLGTAALPALSRSAARQDWLGWSQELRRTLRMALYVALPAGAGMCVFAEPIVRLLFEYRNFDAAATLRVAHVLSVYGVALWAFFVHYLVTRAFYSLGDVRTPLKLSAALLPLNVALSLVLIWQPPLREAGFAVSSAVTSTLTAAAGLLLLRRRARDVFDVALARAAGLMLLAAVAGGAAAHFARLAWQPLLPSAVIAARALDALPALTLLALVFWGLTRGLGLPEARLLTRWGRHSAPSD